MNYNDYPEGLKAHIIELEDELKEQKAQTLRFKRESEHNGLVCDNLIKEKKEFQARIKEIEKEKRALENEFVLANSNP